MRPYIATVIAPLVIVALATPLIAGWIGRNPLYGFRTPRTLGSDAVWYPANRMAGGLLLMAGFVWLTTGILVGVAAVGVATLGSVLYVGWLVAHQRPN